MVQKEKITNKQQFCVRKCLLDARGQRRNGQTGLSWQKGTGTQIVRTEVCRRASLNSQHVELWGRWATAAEKHTECHSCQLRTRNSGYNSHGSPKLDNRRLEKHCLGLMSLDFCCNSQTVGSKFGINNIKAELSNFFYLNWTALESL